MSENKRKIIIKKLKSKKEKKLSKEELKKAVSSEKITQTHLLEVSKAKEDDNVDYLIPKEKEAITISEAKPAIGVKESSKDFRQKRYISIQNKLLPFWKQALYITILSMASAFVLDYIINPSGLFAVGTSAIAQGFSYMAEAIYVTKNDGVLSTPVLQSSVFWLVWTTINIPIIIFTYYNFTNRFLLLTILFVVISTSFSFITKEIPGLTNPDFIFHKIAGDNTESTRIILGAVGGVMYGALSGLSLKVGGSTGGSDPIARYLSKTRAINIGKFNLIFSSSIMVTFLIINDFIINPDPKGPEGIEQFFLIIFGAKLLGSLVFFSISSSALDKIYPTTKTLHLVIDSEKGEEISEHLISESWTRGHTITKISSRNKQKTGKDKYSISIIINSRELQDILYFINNLDEEAFITSTPITGVYGHFDARSKVDS